MKSHTSPHFQLYSYNRHESAYEAECWRMYLYAIIALCVNGYVSLTGFTSFTPLPTCYIIKSTSEITAFKMTYRSTITASRDMEHFVIQLSILMVVENISETNSRTRCIAHNEDNYHEYRIRPNQ